MTWLILHTIKVLGTIGLPPDNWKITNKKKRCSGFHLKKTGSNLYFTVLSQCEIKLCVKGTLNTQFFCFSI